MPAKQVWRSFNEARGFVRSLNLKNFTEWIEYCKFGKDGMPKPNDIPDAPGRFYKDNGWKGMNDWLGNEDRVISDEARRKMSETRKGIWRPFEEARDFARSLNLRSVSEWRQYRKSNKKPDDIPSHPEYIYKDNGWKDWVDWLGNQGREWRPFEEAKDFARSLQLKNTKEWEEYRNSGKKPDDIPSHPNVIYKNNDWISWIDWLGYEELA